MLVPGLLALVFGWLAFRSRVTGVYLSILTQAMTLALSLYLFQNDTGLRGNNGLSGLQNIPGLLHLPQSTVALWFFWASALALGLGYCCSRGWCRASSGPSSAPSATMRPRAVSGLPCRKLQAGGVHPDRHGVGDRRRALLPAGGHHQPRRDRAHHVHLPCRLGGHRRARAALRRGDRRGSVSLLSSWFTGGGAPDIDLGFYRIVWTDWWLVLLGLGFVAVTLFFPRGIGGLFDYLVRKP